MSCTSSFHMRLLFAPLALLLLCAPAISSAQSSAYSVEQLGVLPGETFAIPFGINARGDVVGWCGFYRAFLYTNGTGMTELFGPAGWSSSIARAISDNGAIVGEASISGVPFHAVRWSGNVAQVITEPDVTSKAWDIGPDGTIVGDTPADALNTAGFIFTDGNGTVLIEPSRSTSHAYDISDAGLVTGTMTVGSFYHAFRFVPGGTNVDLGALPGLPGSYGKAINVSGQVAGSLLSATGNTEHVFRYTDGLGMVDLGGVGSLNDAWAINARGDVVGNGRPTAGLERAFIYTDNGGLQDLTLLIDPALGLRLLAAYDINDAGQIVATATSSITGNRYGVRLTPAVSVGPLAALAVSPVKLAAGSTGTGWVTLTSAAPAGGVTIALSTSSTSVTLPGHVFVPQNARHASFTVTASAVQNTTAAQITASYAGATRTASVEITPAATTGVDGRTPGIVRAMVAAPNPGTPSTRLQYQLDASATVRVGIYDVAGGLVRTLFNAPQTAQIEPYSVLWDGRNQAGAAVPSGVYFFRIEAGAFHDSVKFVIVR